MYHLHFQSTVFNFETWVIPCQINKPVQFGYQLNLINLYTLFLLSKNARIRFLRVIFFSRHFKNFKNVINFLKINFCHNAACKKFPPILALFELESSF